MSIPQGGGFNNLPVTNYGNSSSDQATEVNQTEDNPTPTSSVLSPEQQLAVKSGIECLVKAIINKTPANQLKPERLAQIQHYCRFYEVSFPEPYEFEAGSKAFISAVLEAHRLKHTEDNYSPINWKSMELLFFTLYRENQNFITTGLQDRKDQVIAALRETPTTNNQPVPANLGGTTLNISTLNDVQFGEVINLTVTIIVNQTYQATLRIFLIHEGSNSIIKYGFFKNGNMTPITNGMIFPIRIPCKEDTNPDEISGYTRIIGFKELTGADKFKIRITYGPFSTESNTFTIG